MVDFMFKVGHVFLWAITLGLVFIFVGAVCLSIEKVRDEHKNGPKIETTVNAVGQTVAVLSSRHINYWVEKNPKMKIVAITNLDDATVVIVAEGATTVVEVE